MKSSISGLSFDNFQESAWRDSEPQEKSVSRQQFEKETYRIQES